MTVVASPAEAVDDTHLSLQGMKRNTIRTYLLAVSLVIVSTAAQGDPSLHESIGLALHNVKGDFSTELDGPFNAASHACIGAHTVEVLGEVRIRELGVTPDTAMQIFGNAPLTPLGLTNAEVNGLLDAIDGCIPFGEIWAFLALSAQNTDNLIETDEQRTKLAACVAATPGREAVRDAWKTLFTRSTEAFQTQFDEMYQSSMSCFAEVFCGSAYVGAAITPGMFQALVTKGACPFE